MLGQNIKFADLNSLSGLKKLDESFLRYVSIYAPNLEQQVLYYRDIGSDKLKDIAYSKFIIELAPLVDDFLADLFQINKENLEQKKTYEQFDIIYEARRKFIQRYVLKKYKKQDVDQLDFSTISQNLEKNIGNITQEKLASFIVKWQLDSDRYQAELECAAQYCAFMHYNNSSLELFCVPRNVDADNQIRDYKVRQLEQKTYIGFDYRDHTREVDAAMHTKYCIYCHKQGKDSCSKGFHQINPEKHPKKDKDGCPLKQKISEMNMLKNMGLNIAALATIIIDNPMVASTGHRICNDCMKTCIYQKQEPVNVPMIETSILERVLDFPWGVEIYLLLTKWNPLNIDSPLPKENSGYNVLVTGLGPAGFALSHYLINEGHGVVAIDGLKISPLHFDINKPIKNWAEIKIDLSKKRPQGFGGVAEYGITNRWDKNNLTLIRLILERRQAFRVYGGVRLGSNITTKQVFDCKFDHISLCLGAGKPNYINDKNYFAKGVKSAADFLMNLQQGAPHFEDSNSNMQIRLPAIIIGCGLTAIDSAVELLHYYPEQVKKFAKRWKEDKYTYLNEEEQSIAREYLEHAKLFDQAKNDEERLEILHKLGGVTICYRKNIKDSPAYRLNHEEIEHAMAIGVVFIENVSPERVDLDQYNSVARLNLSNKATIEAKTILIAIGTGKNEFIDIDGLENIDSDIFKNKSNNISYFGDCNQKYAGSVVKALASARNGYKDISESLRLNKPRSKIIPDLKIQSKICGVKQVSDDILEIKIHSEYCSNNFKAGQFFRLQNYANKLNEAMEPLAVTATKVDRQENIISFIIQNVGRSSNLAHQFKAGDDVVLMGPTGSPTKMVADKNVLLIGGGIGNALLLPVANSLQENGCNINFISGYKKLNDLIYAEEIENVSDNLIRSFEQDADPNSQPKLNIHILQDSSVLTYRSTLRRLALKCESLIQVGNWYDNTGNIIDALKLAKTNGLLDNIERVYCNGSNAMIDAILKNKHLFPDKIQITYSVNSPMQCMMKGICGQCIQKTNDSKGYVFSCACQDLDTDLIDLQSSQARLEQNSLFEKLL